MEYSIKNGIKMVYICNYLGMGGYNTLWVTNDDQSRPRKLD